jgi:hypothetical protein
MPFMLYVSPVPVGAVTVREPVDDVQLGCVLDTVGCAGIGGAALMTAFDAGEIHPSLFFALM